MAYLVGACRLTRIFDPDEVLQGMWPISWHVALLGSLILMKYFRACGLSRWGVLPNWIFNPDEVLQGLWPISLGRVALLGSLILMKYFKAYGLSRWGVSPYWDL
jgi:lipid-A-disaccharide synthase-like uncharacterized protein